MSKVKTIAEAPNKIKFRHSLRRKEAEIKKSRRKESASAARYRGYIFIDEKPIYEHSVEVIPEKRETVYETVDRKGYRESPYVPGHFNIYYYTQQVRVGEKVTPEQRIRHRWFVGYEAIEKPYIQKIDYSSKKKEKRASNKKVRHSRFREIPTGGSGYKKVFDIAWS